VDAVLSDQWGIVPLVEKYLQGDLSFHDLWIQQNVHRIFFPKLIFFFLVETTSWNHAFEIGVILACALVVFLTIASRLAIIFKSQKPAPVILLINAALLSILLFSPAQWRNWLWGMQIQMMLNLAACVTGLCILSSGVSVKRVGWAVVLGFVGTHSFATGVMYWFVGFIILFLAEAKDKRSRSIALLSWLLFSALSLLSFFNGYTPKGEGLSGLMESPLEFVLYVLAYLGNPIVQQNAWGAIIVGIAGLIGLFLLFIYLRKRHGVPCGVLLPFLGIALYALGGAAMTAVGRTHFGHDQALASRYITFGQLLWVANITFLCVALAKLKRPGRILPVTLKETGITFVLLIIIAFVAVGHYQGAEQGKAFSEVKKAARQSILSSYPYLKVKVVQMLCRPHPELTVELLTFLHDNRLSLFRKVP
jgi:hypothetical protein